MKEGNRQAYTSQTCHDGIMKSIDEDMKLKQSATQLDYCVPDETKPSFCGVTNVANQKHVQ
jgi:hypothetical protein